MTTASRYQIDTKWQWNKETNQWGMTNMSVERVQETISEYDHETGETTIRSVGRTEYDMTLCQENRSGLLFWYHVIDGKELPQWVVDTLPDVSAGNLVHGNYVVCRTRRPTQAKVVSKEEFEQEYVEL